MKYRKKRKTMNMKQFLEKMAMALGIAGIVGCNTPADARKSALVLEPTEYIKALQADNAAFLLDVRRADEYAEGHLPGAALLDVTDSIGFAEGMKSLDKEKTIYIYCRSGRRSQTAAKRLIDNGFRVIDMQGGYNAWKKLEK